MTTFMQQATCTNNDPDSSNLLVFLIDSSSFLHAVDGWVGGWWVGRWTASGAARCQIIRITLFASLEGTWHCLKSRGEGQ